MAACAADNSDRTSPDDMRLLTVNCAATRTTVEYEGSDVSHLVWNDGDKVAYVTDMAGDLFRVAEVTNNRFKAEIPAAASSANTLVALWPVADNEGAALAAATAELRSEIPQILGAPFDGGLLPMFARVTVPDNDTQVDAFYTPLGVIVRLTIDMYGHETEILKSVTLSAAEDMVGRFGVDPSSDGGWSFAGTSKSVKAVFSTDEQIGGDPFDVYMVVKRGAYTQVKVEVETDRSVYEVGDGEMSLDVEGRTLYRIAVPALEERPEPEPPYFKQVMSVDEITADGKYLIAAVADAAGMVYAVAKPETWYNNSNFGLDETRLYYSDKGVLYDEDTEALTWLFAPHPSEAGKFSIKFGHDRYYLCAMGSVMTEPWYSDQWPFGFAQREAEELPDLSEGRWYWQISFSDGEATVTSPDLGSDWWIVWNKSKRDFRMGNADYGYTAPLVILKLNE